ncbi:Tyrosine--tRNA ligase (fragment) [Methylocella tundrae]
MVHGREAALSASEAARKTFEEGALAETLPSVEIAASEIEAGLGVLAAFVKAGLVASTSEARRQIKGGGLRVNDEVISDERAMIAPAAAAKGVVKLSLGRKRHILLKLV